MKFPISFKRRNKNKDKKTGKPSSVIASDRRECGNLSRFKAIFSRLKPIGKFFKVISKPLVPIGRFFKNLFLKIGKKLSFFKPYFNKKYLKFAGIFILAIYLVSAAVFAVGLYRYNWGGKARNFSVSIYPFPAAYVSGSIIWYHDLNREYEHAKFYSEKSQQPITDETAFKKSILDQMIDLRLWQIQARKNSVKVTRKDVDDSYNKLVEQAGGGDKAKEMLKDFWNMDLGDLRRLIKDQLPKEKLTEKLQSEILVSVHARHILIKDNEALAKEVAQKAKSGTKFEDLVTQYSQDDTTKSNGGDLGFFNRGVMDIEFENAVFGMKAGDISDPVKTQFGFHIIKLEERKGTIDKTAEVWFQEIKDKAKIAKFTAK